MAISRKQIIKNLQSNGWFIDLHKNAGVPISQTEVIAYNPKDGKTFCATLNELQTDYDNCISVNHLYG